MCVRYWWQDILFVVVYSGVWQFRDHWVNITLQTLVMFDKVDTHSVLLFHTVNGNALFTCNLPVPWVKESVVLSNHVWSKYWLPMAFLTPKLIASNPIKKVDSSIQIKLAFFSPTSIDFYAQGADASLGNQFFAFDAKAIFSEIVPGNNKMTLPFLLCAFWTCFQQ